MRRNDFINTNKKIKHPLTEEEVLDDVEKNLITDEDKVQQISFEQNIQWTRQENNDE